MSFDALAYAQQQQGAGVPQDQATAQASCLRQALEEQERTLATKAALAELQADVKTQMAELRADFAELRAEVKTDIASVRNDLSGLRTDFALLEARLTKWMLDAAGVGGLLGGAIGVASRLLLKP